MAENEMMTGYLAGKSDAGEGKVKKYYECIAKHDDE